MGRTYRDSTHVLLDLLESMSSLKLLSEIERQSRLSYDVASVLVNELIKKNFAIKVEENTYCKYQLSTEGIEFLKHLRIWCE